MGVSCNCSMQGLGCSTQTPYLWGTGLVAPWHVGSYSPNQGWNPSPRHCKADSQPLDQGSPSKSLSSVQFSHSVMSNSLRPHGLQHARPPCPSPTSGVCSNSCPLSQWCHPTISSSATPVSSCPQSFPASGSFPVNQLFTSGGQSIGASASASVLPVNIQDWFPLGWTGLISAVQGTVKSPQHTTVQMHQFFDAQLSLWSNSHIHTWLLEKP